VTPELLADMMAIHGNYEGRHRCLSQNSAADSRALQQDRHRLSAHGQGRRGDRQLWSGNALDRKFAAPYNNLGTVYFHENDNKRAKQLYKKSIKLDAETAPSGATSARCTWSNGSTATERRPMRKPSYLIPTSSRRSP
jgi:hypothetical protein